MAKRPASFSFRGDHRRRRPVRARKTQPMGAAPNGRVRHLFLATGNPAGEYSRMNLRAPELQILGLLVPWNVGIGVIGLLLSWMVTTVLERTGLTRFIWHLPLFFLALGVLITSVLGVFLHP
jgi:hypothetical protein